MTDKRTTQVPVEVALTPDETPGRITLDGVEVIYQGQPATRATMVGVEVIYQGAGNVRMTVEGVEVIYQGNGNVRATMVGIEVIYIERARPAAWATIIDT